MSTDHHHLPSATPSRIEQVALGLFYIACGLFCIVFFRQIVGQTFARQVELVDGVRINRFVLHLLMTGLCLGAEAVALGWKGSSLDRICRFSNSARHDVIMGLLSMSGLFGATVAILAAYSALLAFFHNPVQLLGGVLPTTTATHSVWFEIGRGLLAVLAMDLVSYVTHVLYHRVGFLWEIHRYHHSATEFTILTGSRTHLVEKMVNRCCQMIPVALIGAEPDTFLVILIIRGFLERSQHCNLRWNLGWFGRWFIYSPEDHRIHHSVEKEHHDLNYGNIFPIWDHLFGTWYKGTKTPDVIGIGPHDHVDESIAKEHVVRVMASLRKLTRLFRRKRVERKVPTDTTVGAK